MKDLIDSERGRVARDKYLVIARSMREYEDSLYHGWVENQELHLASYLKRTILRTAELELTAERPEVSSPGEDRLFHSVLADQSESNGFVPLAPSETFLVNFASELNEIIQETKYLEQLGYNIPELARNVSLQEDSYIKYRDGLDKCVRRYNQLIYSLPEAEYILLEERVRILQKIIRPGCKRHNWNSLAISDYINRCQEGLSTFESFVTQVLHL